MSFWFIIGKTDGTITRLGQYQANYNDIGIPNPDWRDVGPTPPTHNSMQSLSFSPKSKSSQGYRQFRERRRA